MRKLIKETALMALVGSITGFANADPARLVEIERTGLAGGRTVVLIPGLASSADVWQETRHLLEADYDVRTVQVAGFAGAPKVEVTGNYTDAIAVAIEEDLTAHPGKLPVLVGHSMGGFVSLKVALAAPDLIDELVIVDSLPFLAGLFMPGATPEMAAMQAPVMAAQMAAMPREAFDAQQAAGFGRLVKTRDFISVLNDWSSQSDQLVVSKVMGELLGTDLRADLTGLETETLVMVPWDELMDVPSEMIEGLYRDQYKAGANTRLEMVDESFHFIMIDQPRRFQNILLNAIED